MTCNGKKQLLSESDVVFHKCWAFEGPISSSFREKKQRNERENACTKAVE
jgi:hypothetical protein